MSDGLSISEISMLNDQERMQAISHNLTNVNTTGYKQQAVRTQGFTEIIQTVRTQGLDDVKTQHIVSETPVVNVVTDASEGALKYTGNPLDLSLNNDLYFVIKTPHGELFTRQGDFHLDAMGRLVTATGQPVMGNGGEIRLTSDKPVINAQGEMFINNEQVAQLKLVKMPAHAELHPAGGALYQTTADVALQVAKDDLVRQGYLEASNVNMTTEMIKMIEVTRHFESTQKVIRGYDNMLDNAINVIGEF